MAIGAGQSALYDYALPIAQQDAEAAQKGGYPHFMIKEIHEQEKVLKVQLKTQSIFLRYIVAVLWTQIEHPSNNLLFYRLAL